MNNSRRPDNDRDAVTLTAVMVLLLVAGSLVGLTAMVMPTFLVFPMILFGFLFVGSFHYITWGWWMSNRKPVDEDE